MWEQLPSKLGAVPTGGVDREQAEAIHDAGREAVVEVLLAMGNRSRTRRWHP